MSFDTASENYLKSSDHAVGEDLEYVSEYFKSHIFTNQLDIATAAGHFTKSFNSKNQFAIDVSLNMLKTAKKNFKINYVIQSNAEYLPFKSDFFDLISCRIALHHFKEPMLFFKEVCRCLKDDGIFVLIDSIVDIDDAFLNCIEYVRDKTHVRSYTIPEILEFSKSMFRLENFKNIYKKHNFSEWVKRLNNSYDNIKEIENQFFDLPERIKKELIIEFDGHNIVSYTDKKGLFIFRKL